jgi:drug/metabolite transporter (DMT)-like permease
VNNLTGIGNGNSRERAIGFACVSLAAAIWAVYPVVTRMGLKQSFEPAELIILRFGVSALLLAPLFLRDLRTLSTGAWVKGAHLAICHGTLLTLLLFEGLRRAPAAHSPAIMQGLIPLWVALFLWLTRKEQIAPRRKIGLLTIALGAVVLGTASVGGYDMRTMSGDLLFVAASALAAGYFVQMQSVAMPSAVATMFVSFYSILAILPWWISSRAETNCFKLCREIAAQAFVQGMLLAVVSVLALNRAIAALGSQTTSVFLSIVPAGTAMIGWIVLDEHPSATEMMAIALVVGGMLVVGRTIQRNSGSNGM